MDSDIEIDDFIEHFGVKGMRWGVRKSKENTNSNKQNGRSSGSTKESSNVRTKKTMKVLGTAAGIALVAAGAVMAPKIIRKTKSEIGARQARKAIEEYRSRSKNLPFVFNGVDGSGNPFRVAANDEATLAVTIKALLTPID